MCEINKHDKANETLYIAVTSFAYTNIYYTKIPLGLSPVTIIPYDVNGMMSS